MKPFNRKSTIALSLLAGLVLGSLGTFGATTGYTEYETQKSDVEFLENEASVRSPDTDWSNPDALVAEGIADESTVAWMSNEYGFYQDDVFDAPEWKAYEKLTAGKTSGTTSETLQTYEDMVEGVTIPGLNGRADKAYDDLVEAQSNEPGFKFNVLMESSLLLSSTDTVDSAIKDAKEWDFVTKTPSGETPFDALSFETWGLDSPTEEEKDIAREAIRKALVVAIEDYNLNDI